ncbi:hypothetical protein M3Y94_00049900 [Aphelenchoides besseyi]|nr:hypothetical protein M3Y94_00049700 [Aphelenchoides besseyi]KAI6212638.1 hypothetical protein M3Y94_00049800 [Aphelenchoides besseyi]KAI6212639.1 hypothetical protein M3Y94_00049900 [Aphelenchoides besseyi]
MLIVGLLITSTLVTFVDAGSWKLPIQEVKRVNRNNTLGPLHDIYREVLNLDRAYYRGSSVLWIPKKGCKSTVLVTFGEDMRITAAVTFGVAEEIGILGLGNAIRPNERGSAILHEAWRQKLIDEPMFTLYLRKCPYSEDCEKFGTITIGSYDKEMCDKIVGHVKINPKYSGAPGIYMPTDVHKQLMDEINATPTNGRYVVKCDADIDITAICREYCDWYSHLHQHNSQYK